MINSITILGGGTAGFIFALITKQSMPFLDIKVIESSQIGIIGVGEGSTEHWQNFMNFCKIPVDRLFRETGATYKTGIRFENWNGDGKEYWHSLNGDVAWFDYTTATHPEIIKQIYNQQDPLDTVYCGAKNSTHEIPVIDRVHQFHFDTFKLNQFFHTLCQERGINIIDDIIKDVILDEQGYVKELIGEKTNYQADFFVDSSGFRRVITSKLQTRWHDCGKQLPMNSAIAFPTGYKEDIPSHTLSRAVSSGWMWRIPTQDRFGNGYVFCDEFINEDQAVAEAQKFIDEPINVGRKIKFSAGYVDKFWNKNCISVGLAGMFVEPLEATSIGCTIQQAFAFIPCIANWERGNDNSGKIYNNDMKLVASNIIDFVQLHYFTKRNDSEFWRWAKNNIELTDFNKETLETFKNILPSLGNFPGSYIMFKQLNWMQVMHGLGLYNYQSIQTNHKNLYNYLVNQIIPFHQNFVVDKLYPHREILERIKTGRIDKDLTVGDLVKRIP